MSSTTKRCYYEVLGCERGASGDELRKAYKREALKFHPDRNPGDSTAESKFKEVNEAYQVLSDDQKRRVYDQFGHAGLDPASGGFGFDGGISDVFSHMQDLFSEMFSGGFGGAGGPARQARRGQDLRVQVRLTLAEAAFGTKREVNVRAPVRCSDCNGSGAKSGTKPETCGQCRGTGHVSNARGFVMFTSTCPRCQGQGQFVRTPCASCAGHGLVEKPRKVNVTFPAGIDANQRLRVPGQGMPGPGNAPPGDLYVEVDVEEDPRFERDGVDLVTRVHVSIADAALGADIHVPGLDVTEEPHALNIPAGTQSGAVLTLKGKGVPRLDGRGRGSLVVVVQVDIPTAVSPRARELLQELDAELRNGAATEPKVAAGK
jgi:molecular chaperone DnaJ